MNLARLIEAITEEASSERRLSQSTTQTPTLHFRHRYAAERLEKLAAWARTQPQGVNIDLAHYTAMRKRAEEAEEAVRQLQVEHDEERSKRQSLQVQLAEYQQGQAAAGLCIKVALEGGLRTGDRWWMGEMDRVRDLVRDRYQLAARVERLTSVLVRAFSAIDDGKDDEIPWDEARDIYNATPPAALARVKAEAVREFKDELTKSVSVILKPHVEGVCAVVTQRLIDEAEGD